MSSSAHPDLTDVRRDYAKGSLDERTLNPDPLALLREWLDGAVAAKVLEATAMALATVDASGMPNVRTVLCKGVDARGILFYTNYRSHKGQELDANPKAALDFLWRENNRQARVQGTVEKLSPSESDAYFRVRPRASQIGAWVSDHQSAPITRAALDQRQADLEKRFEGRDVERPPFWGGYRVIPIRFEFWLGGPGRVHDCIAYEPSPSGASEAWTRVRVSP
ncbi:MAG TPA: pyridoxamine 5'-phosphate oxidase [Polyangiaceae bacterium]